jgi:hypothetical protein
LTDLEAILAASTEWPIVPALPQGTAVEISQVPNVKQVVNELEVKD